MTPEQERYVEALYREHHSAMLYAAGRITGDPGAAADVVSQTFLVAIVHIETVMACEDPVKWVYHALKNLAIDEYRRVRRQAAVSLDAIPEAEGAPASLSFEALLPPGLTEEERRILILRGDLGLDYAEIAGRLHTTESACRMKYSRARKRCAELMGPP